MNNALIITAIGMGLVFGAILLLWALMASLVKITSKRSRNVTSDIVDEQETEIQTGVSSSEKVNRWRAAAIAVSIALIQQSDQNEPHEFPFPPLALVSAWQAVMRTKMHSKRGMLR